VREVFKFIGFILVTIGFLGLIINDFVSDSGRAVTITFAIIEAAGLITLAMAHRGMKRKSTDKV